MTARIAGSEANLSEMKKNEFLKSTKLSPPRLANTLFYPALKRVNRSTSLTVDFQNTLREKKNYLERVLDYRKTAHQEFLQYKKDANRFR